MGQIIGTLAGGRLGTSTATMYAPGGVRAHVQVILANTNTGNTYTVNVGIKRNGETSTRLICGAGTPIIAANSTNTSSGQLVLLSSLLTGLKLSDGDSIVGSASADNVIDFLVTGATET